MSIMCSLNAASFFQQSLIANQPEGLSIHVEKTDVSSIINAWCEVCNKNCTIAHDTKQKLNIHQDRAYCDGLIADILQATNLQMLSRNGHLIFTQPTKGEWVSHQFIHRPVEEISLLLSKLLGNGQKNALLSDLNTNTLWLPHNFYHAHQKAILDLDHPLKCYNILLSWVRINENHLLEPPNIDLSDAIEWLTHKAAPLSWQQVNQWLNHLEQHGLISRANHSYLQLSPGHMSHTVIDENINIPIYNKKGIKQLQTIRIGLDSQMEMLSTTDTEISLHLKLSDASSDKESMAHTKTYIDTIAIIPINHSIPLGVIKKEQRQLNRNCIPLLGNIPILGRAFCQQWSSHQEEKLILVITALGLKDKLGRLDSNQGS